MTFQILTKPKIKETEIFELNGETVHRVIMDLNGHTVQIVAYDESPMLTVDIDNTIGAQVHILDLDEYISNIIGG